MEEGEGGATQLQHGELSQMCVLSGGMIPVAGCDVLALGSYECL